MTIQCRKLVQVMQNNVYIRFCDFVCLRLPLFAGNLHVYSSKMGSAGESDCAKSRVEAKSPQIKKEHWGTANKIKAKVKVASALMPF